MANDRGILYFCLGCAAGAAATMIANSRTGREAIAFLRGRVDLGVDNIREGVENLSGAVNNAAAHAAKSARHQVENVGAALDAGRLAYEEARKATP